MRKRTGKDLVCSVCGVTFYRPACHIKDDTKYCNRKCFFVGRPKQTNTGKTHFQKGIIPWNKGYKGIHLSPKSEFKKGERPWNYGKPNPSARDEKHPNWKGGITPLRVRLWQCSKHTIWRNSIFERDNWTCVLCGARSKKGFPVYLEADHHPKAFYKIRDEYSLKSYDEALNCAELWDITNGRTLCKECHKNETKKLRIGMVSQMGNISR